MNIRRQLVLPTTTVALLAISLSGCSNWFKAETAYDPVEISEITPLTQIHEQWSKRIDKGTKGRLNGVTLAHGEQRIYIASITGAVYAVSNADGQILWQASIPSSIQAGPTFHQGKVAVTTSDGEVYVLSSQDGSTRFSKQLNADIVAPPAFTSNGDVIVRSVNDQIFALNGQDGSILWQKDFKAPQLRLRTSSAPLIDQDRIYLGMSQGRIICLDAQSGKVIWEKELGVPSSGRGVGQIKDISATPLRIGNSLIVLGFNGAMSALNPETGDIKWQRNLQGYSGMAKSAPYIYGIDAENQIWAIDSETGEAKWKQDRLKFRQLTQPALIGSQLAVGDIEGYVHLISTRDGSLLNRIRIDKSRISARPLVDGRLLFIYTEKGTLAALDVGTSSSISPNDIPVGQRATRGALEQTTPTPQPFNIDKYESSIDGDLNQDVAPLP